MLDRLAELAALYPGKVALRDAASGHELRYEELYARSAATAKALSAKGLRPGERVAVLAQNRVETIQLFFAAASLRLILVPLNCRLALPELAAVIEDCGPAALFYGPEFLESARTLAAGRWGLETFRWSASQRLRPTRVGRPRAAARRKTLP